jgi:hypothetical protein
VHRAGRVHGGHRVCTVALARHGRALLRGSVTNMTAE